MAARHRRSRRKPRFSRLGRVGFLCLLVVGATIYGTVGYMIIEGWSFLDAMYMTVITLTTVGFREVRPLDESGMVFTMTLTMMGVVLVLVTIAAIAAWVADEQLSQRRRRRRMEKRVNKLSDHFIVCAYGRVGRAVAADLAGAGVPFVVLDIDEELEPRMRDEGVTYMLGDPTKEEVLLEAGVERARGLICAVDSDTTNVFITLTARSLNPSLLIVARAAERETIQRLQKAGADHIVSPYVSSGQHMARMALDPGVQDVLDAVGAPEPD